MISASSLNYVHEIAEELEEFLEIDYNEAFKLAIEFWKAESLNSINNSLDKTL